MPLFALVTSAKNVLYITETSLWRVAVAQAGHHARTEVDVKVTIDTDSGEHGIMTVLIKSSLPCT